MRLLVLVLLISILGCSHTTPTLQASDKTFDTHLDEFVRESQGMFTRYELDSRVTLEFHTYKENKEKNYQVVGTCWPNLFSKSVIWINKEWWKDDYRSDYERMEVVFHELGHCVLYRGHTIKKKDEDDGFFNWWERVLLKLGIYTPKGYLKDGCPASIMHPYTLWDFCIIKHHKYYMDELFRRI